MDLKANLENLCGDAMERIEVTNLHSWCASFMRKQGHRFAIVKESDRERLFDQARSEMGGDEFPLRFYREEWDQVGCFRHQLLLRPPEAHPRSGWSAAGSARRT